VKKVLIVQGPGQAAFAEIQKARIGEISQKYGVTGLTPEILGSIEEVSQLLKDGGVHAVLLLGEYDVNVVKALKQGHGDVRFMILYEYPAKPEVVVLPQAWFGLNMLERFLFVGQ
jgi:hypothetical protein